MREQVHRGPGNILIFLVCLAAIIIFYNGLIEAELAFAESRGAPAEPAFGLAAEPEETAAEAVRETDGEKGRKESDGAVGAVPDMEAASVRGAGQGSAAGSDELPPVPNGAPDEAHMPAMEQADRQIYVTTAYYLNVRAESNAGSKVLRTVKQGTLLTVTERLENGWLKLAHEGYVHGAYARPAGTEAEPRMAVKPAAGKDAAGRTGSGAGAMSNKLSKTVSVRETDRPASKSHEVISASGLTKEGIAEILEGTELAGHGLEEAVLAVEDLYGINAYFTIAVMKLESGNGTSRLARVKNNLFGLNATGGNNEQAYSFETKADSVYRFGRLISEKYVGKGLKTIEEVGRKYCPANKKWADLVVRIMNRDRLKV